MFKRNATIKLRTMGFTCYKKIKIKNKKPTMGLVGNLRYFT